jgi:signal transduction histidine kinase
MDLKDFILNEMESILRAWEDFARGVDTSMQALDAKGLRNHAEHILKAVSADMSLSQTEQQQIDKAQGRGPQSDADGPSRTHAMTRLVAGFSMDQMVSEYRALRSSVLRLWFAQESGHQDEHLQQVIRFNEAIDQALAESIATYGAAVERTRDTILGVLGHDLRTPLGAITMAGELLQRAEYFRERERRLSSQITVSAGRATELMNDLLDLARCNFGIGIPVHPEIADLNDICSTSVEELRTAFPSVRITFDDTQPITGHFDPARIAQVFTNLISNAIRHGDQNQPIHVCLSKQGQRAELSVHNFGEVIPEGAKPHIFNSGARYSSFADGEKGSSAGLGLGLFIAAQIVSGHRGEIEVESSAERGTIFRVLLPIHQSGAAFCGP